ncbi:MAG: hypothetical protein H7243_11480 [Sphingomonadaceae bacterium]|nr:hypothetical protein [Sphingomonadaceae bacterium]
MHGQLLSLVVIAALGSSAACAAGLQTEAGAYTRYELLAPASHSFRIRYWITATTPGATTYFNPVRPGSIARDEHVTDAATGKPLAFAEVDGSVAAAAGVEGAKPGNRFIAVSLAHPVPAGGGARLVIDKTYEDAASYRMDGGGIVFDRSLGITRNAVILPPGYRLTAVSVPSQVLEQADGRVAISFWNTSPVAAPLVVRAVPGLARSMIASAVAKSLSERAAQTREIVYYLNPPDTHSFALTHDYTETTPGVAAYVNIVRAGSTASNPSATDLDTGAVLPAEAIRGTAAIRALEPHADGLTDTTDAIVFRFAPVADGASRRLRIAETYTDADRYGLQGDELVWHRSFGRPMNAVVLPPGWTLTNSSVPAIVTTLSDGRTRLDFINPRTDEVDTIITARRIN